MVRKTEEETRFGAGSYRFVADNIHSLEDAITWLCKVRDNAGYKVEYIRLEDIDGNENDTTTRMSADAAPAAICEEIRGKEIGRVALAGTYMGAHCRVAVYLKGYMIHLYLDTLDPLIRDRIVRVFQEVTI